ncbi:MAG: S46 family peptidase [Bacteroidetes bacterium]|nr:S46 family peptidase [Bacteroidota bacterium]
MKKLLLIFTLILLSLRGFSYTPPDEGMWLPMLVERLNFVDIQKMGLHLTPDELYSVNHSSLKDGIVGLSSDGGAPQGFFCTAEVVSKEGLLFTNHHCGYDAIQKQSNLQHDYLTDGFWAMNKNEELQNVGMTASFLIRMEDVTKKVLENVSDTMSDQSRSKKVKEMMDKITREAKKDNKYDAVVKSFYSGNEYYLFLYMTYKDVRLVAAPPSGIGKFGGDTDNWMWPRHTGDFSILRIYSAPDGSAAEYSKDNIPLKCNYALPISLKGVQKDDFAMIWGYPGSTERYLTSFGVNFTTDKLNPALIKLMGKKLDIWKVDMDANRDLNIKYSSKYFGISNSWKNFIGESRGLKRLKVYDKKKELETQFIAWANANPQRREKYGQALNLISNAYAEQEKTATALFYTILGLYRGAEIFDLAQEFMSLYSALQNTSKEAKPAIDDNVKELRETVKTFYKDYSPSTDQKLMAALFKMCYQDVPLDVLPSIVGEIGNKYKGNFDKWAADVFDDSFFTSEEKINKFLDNPKLKKLEKDPVYKAFTNIFEKVNALSQNRQAAQKNRARGERLFIAGLREMNPDKKYYPDANSTMRFTYGKVLDYYGADAVHYDYITHLSGVMEKEDPTNPEFVVPARLKELYQKKDFGPYGSNGDMVVCFLTTNDITGGNSGSPVLNGNGELIGLAFDGNWEAMSGDIAFEPELQRTICVDIRYVLFVIDKYAGAKNIISELTIRN